MTYQDMCDRIDNANVKELEKRATSKGRLDGSYHNDKGETHSLEKFVHVVKAEKDCHVELWWRYCQDCARVHSEMLVGFWEPTNTAYEREIIKHGDAVEQEARKIFAK